MGDSLTALRLELALESMEAILWDWHPATDTVATVPSAASLVGRDIESFEEFSELIHPGDRQRVEETVESALDAETPFSAEFRIEQEGEVRWFETHGRLSPETHGAAPRVVGLTKDITECKRHEEQFQMFVERSSDVITVVDERGCIEYVSPSMSRVFGHDPADLIGENAFDLIHPADREAVMAAFPGNRSLSAGTTVSVEYRTRHRDGSWRWAESRVTTRRDSTERGYVINTRDVTDRVDVERELRQIDESRSLALIASDAGIWDWNPETGEVTWHESCEQLFGVEPGAFEGTYEAFITRVHPADRSAVEHAIARTIHQDEPFHVAFRISRDDGVERWVSSRGKLLSDVDGTPVCLLGVAVDITEQKERERRLSVLERVLRHNIRNKLNIILAHSEQLADAPETDVRERALTIVEASEELYGLSETARRFESTIRPDDSVTKPADVVKRVRNVTAQARIEYAQASIRTHGGGEQWALVHEAFELAITELVENAIRHAGRPDPTVDVYVEGHETTVEVRVVDDGPGIPDLDRAVILKGEETPLEHSMGLGLWLVRWTVANSGGTIDIRDNEPTGTVIEIRLPRLSPGRPPSDVGTD